MKKILASILGLFLFVGIAQADYPASTFFIRPSGTNYVRTNPATLEIGGAMDRIPALYVNNLDVSNCVGCGIAGNPAGLNTQVQYNNGGAFGASANFLFNGNTFALGGTALDSSVFIAGTHTFTPAAGVPVGIAIDSLTNPSANNTSLVGGFIAAESDPTSTRNINQMFGTQMRGRHKGSGTVTDVIGGTFEAIQQGTGGAATITDLIASNQRLQINSASNVTNGIHQLFASQNIAGGGSFTNLYGIYSNPITAGTNSNYFLYYANGANSFNVTGDGKVNIGTPFFSGDAHLDSGRTVTGDADYYETAATLYLNPAADLNRTITGGGFFVSTSGATKNFSGSDIRGIYGFAQFDTPGKSIRSVRGGDYNIQLPSGTITTADGYRANVFTSATVTNLTGVKVEGLIGGTTTQLAGLWVAPFTDNGGAVTTAYSARFDPLGIAGATTSWTIASTGGNNDFVGKSAFGSSSAPTYVVDITGDQRITATGNQQFLYTNSAPTTGGQGVRSEISTANGTIDFSTFKAAPTSGVAKTAGTLTAFSAQMTTNAGDTAGATYNAFDAGSIAGTTSTNNALVIGTGWDNAIIATSGDVKFGTDFKWDNTKKQLQLGGFSPIAATSISPLFVGVTYDAVAPNSYSGATSFVFLNSSADSAQFASSLFYALQINDNHHYSGTIAGMYGSAGIQGGATPTIDAMSGVVGQAGNVGGAGSTVTRMESFRTRIFKPSAGATTTTAAGVYVPDLVGAGTGTLTTYYGVKIDNPTYGANRYGLADDADSNYVLGSISVGKNTAPTAQLDLQGTFLDTVADNTANVFKVVEGANQYLNVSTTNGTEIVTIGNSTTNPQLLVSGTGGAYFGGRIHTLINSVTAANDLVLGTSNEARVTGGTQINGINTTGWNDGDIVTLSFAGAQTLTHFHAVGANTAPLFLSGSADLTFGASGGTITFIFDGNLAEWRELSRTAY